MNYMPAVKFSERLDLEENFSFQDENLTDRLKVLLFVRLLFKYIMAI